MNAYDTSIALQAQACMVRVEGMKAENQHRLDCGLGIAYGEEAFEAEAKAIDWYASLLQSSIIR